MSIFDEDTIPRIRSTLGNLLGGELMDGIKMSVPVTDEHTMHFESKMESPAPREWTLRVKVTTSIAPESFEGNSYPYLWEVNDEGEAFVEEWKDLIADIPWLAESSWDFMIDKAYDCGDDVKMVTYGEQVSVNAEDVLAGLNTDQQVVRVSYTVPREMYVVVDEDVDIDDPEAVARQVNNLGYKELPLTELDPEMVRSSLSPHNAPSIESVDMAEVNDLDIEVVESRYADN